MRGIVTMGATADEALALEAGGLDLVVASGLKPAGIGPRFCGRLKRALRAFRLRAAWPMPSDRRWWRPVASPMGGPSPRRSPSAPTALRLARRSWRATSPMPRPGIAPHCLVRVGTTLC